MPKGRIPSKQLWMWPQHIDCSAKLSRSSAWLCLPSSHPVFPAGCSKWCQYNSHLATFPSSLKEPASAIKEVSLKAVFKSWSKI